MPTSKSISPAQSSSAPRPHRRCVWPALFALFVAVGSPVFALINTVYFSEDFESGLGAWNPGVGVIVDAAGHGKVLTFTAQASGGSTYTKIAVAPLSTPVYISFDYMGTGGFLGININTDDWLFGKNYGGTFGAVDLTYDTTWRHYERIIPAGANLPATIMLEDFWGPSNGGAFFDNLIVANYSGASGPVTPTSAPDGGATAALLGCSAFLLLVVRRLQRSRAE